MPSLCPQCGQAKYDAASCPNPYHGRTQAMTTLTVSELREKAIQEIDAIVGSGLSFSAKLGLTKIAVARLLAEQQRDQARKLLEELRKSTDWGWNADITARINEFLAPPAAKEETGK